MAFSINSFLFFIPVKMEPMDTSSPPMDSSQAATTTTVPPPTYVTNAALRPAALPSATPSTPKTASTPASVKPANNSSSSVSVTTKSALLERITSSNPATTTNILQTSMLAGHLTGAIPISRNSALVPTSGNAGSVGHTPGSRTAQNGGTEVPQTLYLTQRHQTVAPENWTVLDVCHFLKYNDCSSYVEIFHRKVSNNI